MPKFRTQFSEDRQRSFAPVGDPIYHEYTGRYNERGSLELVETGSYDIRDYIQSFADDVDLKLILERFSRGDVDALNRKQGLYFDATLCPGSYAEALNQLLEGERAFGQLPSDVRKSFDNNYLSWLSSIGTNDWNSKMTVTQPDQAAPEEVVTNE